MSGRQLAKAAADASSWPPRLWTTSPCRVVSPSQCLLFACVPGVCAMVFYASVDRLRRRVGLRIYIHRYLTYLFIMYVRAHARALIEMHFDNHSTRRHEPPPRRKSGHEHARTDCTAPPHRHRGWLDNKTKGPFQGHKCNHVKDDNFTFLESDARQNVVYLHTVYYYCLINI